MAYEDIVLGTLMRSLVTQPSTEKAIRPDNTESSATRPAQFGSYIDQQQQGVNSAPTSNRRTLARVWRRLRHR